MTETQGSSRPSKAAPNHVRYSPNPHGIPRWVPVAVLASLLLVSLPAWALAAPSPANASAPLGPGVQPLGSSAAPSGTWAWGASANLSLSVQIVGAYDATQNLSGGNLTQNGAYVSLSESAAMRYAAYAIVNETSPSATQRYVVLQAAEYEHLALGIAASGTFPAPGNYSNGSSVPLQPMNISLQASVEVLNYYRAFLNFTSGANGSLALNDEHVQALRAFNLSLAATNFPNATTNATGQVDLKYVSGAISVRGWVAGDLRANFTPALPLVEGPLFVGKSWNASSQAIFNGTESYAAAFSASVPGGATYHSTNSGSVSANATVPVDLTFRVVGVRTVFFPGGGSETDYLVAYNDSAGSGGTLVSNGLIVLPASDATHAGGVTPMVSERPATQPLTATAQPGARILYSSSRSMPDSQESRPFGSSTVTAAPITPASAQAAINTLRTPAPSPGGLELPVALLALGGLVVVGIAAALFRRSRHRLSRWR